MLEQTVAAYTFSKSFSMSGWRLGFAVAARVIDVSASSRTAPCRGAAFHANGGHRRVRDEPGIATRHGSSGKGRAARGGREQNRWRLVPDAGGTFYAFPSVGGVCDRLGITSHGLALFLLEGADDTRGVACLGGECFGEGRSGFLRLLAQPDERIAEAFAFMADAFERSDRVEAYLQAAPGVSVHPALRRTRRQHAHNRAGFGEAGSAFARA